MSEYRQNLFDHEPQPLNKADKQQFRATIEKLLGEKSYGRSQEDGHTATFKLPDTEGFEFLTLRTIFISGEYQIGWHATWERCLGEYTLDPDPIVGKREVWLTEEYSLEKAPSRATYESFITEVDDDGEVYDYIPEDHQADLQGDTFREQDALLQNHFDATESLQMRFDFDHFDRAKLTNLLRHAEDLHEGHQVPPFDRVIHD